MMKLPEANGKEENLETMVDETSAKRTKFAKAASAIGAGIVYVMATFFPMKAEAIEHKLDGYVRHLFTELPDTLPIEGALVTVEHNPDTLTDTTDVKGYFSFDDTVGVEEDNRRIITPVKSIESYLVGNNLRFNLFSDKSYGLGLKLYDISGRAVKSLKKEINEGDNSIDLSLSEFSNGQYFYRMVKNGKVMSKGKLTHMKGGAGNINIDLNKAYGFEENNEDNNRIITLNSKGHKGNDYKLTITKDGFYERVFYLMGLDSDTTIKENMADTLKLPSYYCDKVLRFNPDQWTRKWLTQPQWFIDTLTVYGDLTTSTMTQEHIDSCKSFINNVVERYTRGCILGHDSLITVGDYPDTIPEEGLYVFRLDKNLPGGGTFNSWPDNPGSKEITAALVRFQTYASGLSLKVTLLHEGLSGLIDGGRTNGGGWEDKTIFDKSTFLLEPSEMDWRGGYFIYSPNRMWNKAPDKEPQP